MADMIKRKIDARFFLFSLLLLCTLLFVASCSSNEIPVTELTNSQNGETINLGITREIAENSLSSYSKKIIEVPVNSLIHVVYGASMSEKIDIAYDNNNVIVYYAIGGESAGTGSGEIVQDSSIWNLNGISIGSSINDVIDVFGLPTKSSYEFLDESGNILNDIEHLTLDYYYNSHNELLESSASSSASSVITLSFVDSKLDRFVVTQTDT